MLVKVLYDPKLANGIVIWGTSRRSVTVRDEHNRLALQWALDQAEPQAIVRRRD